MHDFLTSPAFAAVVVVAFVAAGIAAAIIALTFWKNGIDRLSRRDDD